MKIRKATKKDTKKILELGRELGRHMTTLFLKSKKRLIKKKGKFLKKIKNLSINSKVLLSSMTGRCLDNKKRRFGIINLEKEYNTNCKYIYLKEDFSKAEKELLKKEFIKKEDKKIRLLIQYDEIYLIDEELRDYIYVKHLSKKQKLRKGKAEIIHLVSEGKGKINGYLEGHTIKFSGFGGFGEVWELVILKKERGKGIGTSLIKKFMDICKKKGIYHIMISTSKSNKEAIKLYKKIGFKKSKTYNLYWTPYKN